MGHSPFHAKRRTRPLAARRRPQARLRVEELEARTLLSVYTPVQVRHAYGVDRITFNHGAVRGDGNGQTIAIVDAYQAPTIQGDLAAFSRRYRLPQLDGRNGHGTFRVIDLSHGTPSPSGDDWTLETALDVEWAHAIAPKANILLVEAASDNQDDFTGRPTDLLNAVHVAATTPGVVAVSMSWGADESPFETSWDRYFITPGVTFVASSGDTGAGTIWPAVSPNVVSVGGTTLRLTRSNAILGETGWGNGFSSNYYGGSGGGFSQFESLPPYQQNAGISATYTQYGARLNPDVAYDANPNTGYIVRDSADGGWLRVGGTSAGAPQWAALVAIADQGRALNGLPALSGTQTLSTLYSSRTGLHDITSGSSTGAYYIYDNFGDLVGQITAKPGPGYDLVTGLGTPAANLLVPALVNGGTASASHVTPTPAASAPSGTSHLPGPQARTVNADSDLSGLSSLFAAQASLMLPTPTTAQAVPLLPAVSAPAPAATTAPTWSPRSSAGTGHVAAIPGGSDEDARSAEILSLPDNAPDDGGSDPADSTPAPVVPDC